MPADDETQDAVRRVLKRRPPEDLPAGAEDRLRQRLDKERSKKSSAKRVKPGAKRRRKPVSTTK
jgi:hypothetical protein